jgi:hypothetical protein
MTENEKKQKGNINDRKTRSNREKPGTGTGYHQ